MSNVETEPVEVRCGTEADDGPPAGTPRVDVLTPRDVPLGGPRAMTVRRTLPQRARTLIGAWCFADHYGPDDVAETGGMDVAPHPHTGLQTVSWLFSGEIEHRDSLGSHALVRPGELNLMTGGYGIADFRGLHPAHHRPARRPALGGAAGAPSPPGLPAPRPQDRTDRRRRDPGLPRLPRRQHLPGAGLHAPARRQDRP
ncbi:hypothetical protein SCANM63S_08170 [Streptomyces canarius]